jgi:hypothetical protein
MRDGNLAATDVGVSGWDSTILPTLQELAGT